MNSNFLSHSHHFLQLVASTTTAVDVVQIWLRDAAAVSLVLACAVRLLWNFINCLNFSPAYAHQNRILEYDEVRGGMSRVQSNMKMLEILLFFLLKYCQGVGISNEERVYIFLSGGKVEEFPAQKKHQTYTIKNSLHLNDPRWLSRLSFFVSRTTAWVVNLLNFFLPHFNRNLSSSFVVEIFLLFSPFFDQ